VNEVDVDEKKN